MEVDTPAPSLLERLGDSRLGDSRRGAGAGSSGARRTASAPYQKRRDALGSSDADADGMWKHDRHEGGPRESLASRLQSKEIRPRPDLSVVQNALRRVNSDRGGLSIKGASQPGQPIVEVSGLVAGTTPEDVRAIFQSCGPISKAQLATSSTPNSPHVLLFYENRDHALSAVSKYNGIPADGQKLTVTLTSQVSSITERIYAGDKNEDILGSEPSFGKMYSDDIAATDPRAQVLIGDFGTEESTARGERGGGRGRRGRGGRRAGNASRMEVDR